MRALVKTFPGYESLTAVVLDLDRKGLPLADIGERIGREVGFVRATMRQASKRKTTRKLPPERAAAVTDFFHPKYAEKLTAPATQRGLTVAQLMKSIIRTVAEDGLVDAILDDGRVR